jgi:hypothetical protein
MPGRGIAVGLLLMFVMTCRADWESTCLECCFVPAQCRNTQTARTGGHSRCFRHRSFAEGSFREQKAEPLLRAERLSRVLPSAVLAERKRGGGRCNPLVMRDFPVDLPQSSARLSRANLQIRLLKVNLRWAITPAALCTRQANASNARIQLPLALHEEMGMVRHP